jgi:3-oxoacyl-[acyl-carrier protein] reductase
MAAKAGKDADVMADARRKTVPAGRFGTPEEFGAVCAFLCSPLAGYINGQNLLLDGGAYPGTY